MRKEWQRPVRMPRTDFSITDGVTNSASFGERLAADSRAGTALISFLFFPLPPLSGLQSTPARSVLQSGSSSVRSGRPHVLCVITLQTSVLVSPHRENFSSCHGCFLPCRESRLVLRWVKNLQHGCIPSLVQMYGIHTPSVLILCCLSYYDFLAFPQISSWIAASPSPSLSMLLPPAFIFLCFHLLPCSWHSSVFCLCQSKTSIFTILCHSPHTSAPALQFSYIHVGEVPPH